MSEKETVEIEHRPVEAKHCDGCGRSLLVDCGDGEQANVMALSFSVFPPHVAKQVLEPLEDKTYRFCYRCCLKSLGVTHKEPLRYRAWSEAEAAREDVDDE